MTRTLNWAELESDSASPARRPGRRAPARHGVTDIMIELVLERCSSLNLNIRVAESARSAGGGSRFVTVVGWCHVTRDSDITGVTSPAAMP